MHLLSCMESNLNVDVFEQKRKPVSGSARSSPSRLCILEMGEPKIFMMATSDFTSIVTYSQTLTVLTPPKQRSTDHKWKSSHPLEHCLLISQKCVRNSSKKDLKHPWRFVLPIPVFPAPEGLLRHGGCQLIRMVHRGGSQASVAPVSSVTGKAAIGDAAPG